LFFIIQYVNQENISTEQKARSKETRFSQENEHQEWAKCLEETPRQGTQGFSQISIIKFMLFCFNENAGEKSTLEEK